MWKSCTASPKSTGTVIERGVRRAGRPPATRRRDEEVEQHGLLPGRGDQHVAAGAEPGQQRLGHERGEHRRQRRVDRVAAGAEELRAGLGGHGVAGGDDAARHCLQNLGMNSGTSTSMRSDRRSRDCEPMRLTRGSPAGSRSREPDAASSRRGAGLSP